MSLDIPLKLSDRLYLQLSVADDSVAPLVQCQGKLRQAGIEGRFADPSRLHVTVIHFGEIGRAYRELISWQRDITEADFLVGVERLVTSWQELLPVESLFESTVIGLFGDDASTIALKGEVQEHIHAMHSEAYGILRDFIANLGVGYAEAFLKASINFRHASHLSPHITLMKSARPAKIIDIGTVPAIKCYNTSIVFTH